MGDGVAFGIGCRCRRVWLKGITKSLASPLLLPSNIREESAGFPNAESAMDGSLIECEIFGFSQRRSGGAGSRRAAGMIGKLEHWKRSDDEERILGVEH